MKVGLWKIAHAHSGDKADRSEDIDLVASDGLEGVLGLWPTLVWHDLVEPRVSVDVEAVA